MKTSSKGFDLIARHEGLKQTAYKCPAGVWTIGFGHTAGVKEGQRITVQQAVDFLREDVVSAENVINKHLKNLTQNQFDALVSFVFNVGSGNFERSTLLKKAKVNASDPVIRFEFAKWDKATIKGKLTVLAGLTRRRADEANLYFN